MSIAPTHDPVVIIRPMVPVALAHIAGLALGLARPVSTVWLAPAIAAGLAWTAWNLWRSRRIHGPLLRSGYGLLLALACVGCWQGGRLTTGDRAAAAQFEAWDESELVCAQGVVAEEPRESPDLVDLTLRDVRVSALRVGGPAADFKLGVDVRLGGEAARRITAGGGQLPLPGQGVRVWGRLRPAWRETNPVPFNPEHYWRGRGIGGRVTVTRSADVELGAAPSGVKAGFYRLMRAARGAMIGVLRRRLPGERTALARALLLGQEQWLSDERADAFRATGLAHLLAVSGQNTGFILLLILVLARLAGLGPRACSWAGIVGLVAYTALTGMVPSVVRAATMGIFIMGGFALGRVATAPASLATAAFFTLLFDPRNLLRVDWQLSYTCVLGIVLAAPPLCDMLFVKRRGDISRFGWETRKWIGLSLMTMLAVQLALIPIQLYYFRQVYAFSLLTNLVGIPLSMAAMYGGIAVALLGAIPGVGWVAAHLGGAPLSAFLWFVGAADGWRVGLLTLPPLPLVALCGYYALLLTGSWLRTGRDEEFRLDRGQKVSLSLRLPLLLSVLVWAPRFNHPPGGQMDLYMLDVGQGDGLVVRFPNQRIMVIDAGRPAPADQGRYTVGPFLRALGMGRINCLVATHADADHIGGMPYLLDRFRVDSMLEGPDVSESAAFASLRATAARRRTPLLRARAGQELRGFEPARVSLLGPLDGLRDNNASVVLLIELGAARLALTGDLESAGENRILAAGLARDVDVLKVGHHGSGHGTSEAFLRALRPEVALLSVGRANRYGHPAPAVLERLAAEGARVYRTDRQGAIWVRTNGRRIQVYRYLGHE